MSYVIVRNPKLRLLPRWLRVHLGEQYLAVEVQPFFTSDYSQARIFPSREWADTYVHSRVRDGARHPYCAGDVVIRNVLRRVNIPSVVQFKRSTRRQLETAWPHCGCTTGPCERCRASAPAPAVEA